MRFPAFFEFRFKPPSTATAKRLATCQTAAPPAESRRLRGPSTTRNSPRTIHRAPQKSRASCDVHLSRAFRPPAARLEEPKNRPGTTDGKRGRRGRYFTSRGCKVYSAFLDASKAFDKVLHNGLYKKLLDRKAALCFVLLLIIWYSKLHCAVKWIGFMGEWFPIPFIFNITHILYANDMLLSDLPTA